MYTEDGYIIGKCVNGESAAFDLLVDKYKSSIYALAYTKLRNFHDAEDVTQEVFIKAYQKLSTLKRRDNFLAWLFSITVNSCKNFLTSRARRPDGDYIEDQDMTLWAAPSMEAHRSESAAESIREAIDQLPEIYRQTLTLYYLGGLSSKEIARFLGTSVNTVNQRLMRARTKLKEELITMIDTTFAEKKLQPGFTFRIVEAIKSTKVQPISTKPLLPFIGSATVGIVLTFMLFNQFLRPVATPGDLTSSPLPSEIQMTMFGEIPVELMVEASKPPTVLGERGTGVVGNSPEQPRQMNAANVKNSKTEIPASYKLANGLTVILRPVPSSNQVAIVVLFDLGGDHDPLGKSGRAHLLEHLYCTATAGDTPARDAVQLQKRYVAGWNAQTGTDYTVFAGVVEAEQFAAELKDAAARMNDLRITETDLNREVPRILSELRNMYSGVPSLVGINSVRAQLHPIPEGGRFGGAPDHIETMTLDELQQFWQDYYKPNNAVLAIAGGFDVADARRLIHQNFSQISPGVSPPTKPPKSEAKTGEIRFLTAKPLNEDTNGVAAIGYAAPRPGSKEYAPFLIVASRLWASTQYLFQPGKTPPVYFTPLDNGTTLVLQTDLLSDADFESALNQLDQRLNMALTPKLMPEDKQRTLNSMAMLDTVEMPDAMWMQNLYGLAFSTGRRYQLKLNGSELRDAIQRVTDADMQHLAASVFSPEKRDTVIVGENTLAQIEESEVDTSLLPSESETESSTTDTNASAEEVMNAYVEAYRNLDLEAMLPYVTGTAREVVKSFMGVLRGEIPDELVDLYYNDSELSEEMAGFMIQMMKGMAQNPIVQLIYSQVEIVSSEFVGDEFHFQLRIPIPMIEIPDISEIPELQGIEMPEMPEHLEMPDTTLKMRKEDGAWRIYEIIY